MRDAHFVYMWGNGLREKPERDRGPWYIQSVPLYMNFHGAAGDCRKTPGSRGKLLLTVVTPAGVVTALNKGLAQRTTQL